MMEASRRGPRGVQRATRDTGYVSDRVMWGVKVGGVEGDGVRVRASGGGPRRRAASHAGHGVCQRRGDAGGSLRDGGVGWRAGWQAVRWQVGGEEKKTVPLYRCQRVADNEADNVAEARRVADRKRRAAAGGGRHEMGRR